MFGSEKSSKTVAQVGQQVCSSEEAELERQSSLPGQLTGSEKRCGRRGQRIWPESAAESNMAREEAAAETCQAADVISCVEGGKKRGWWASRILSGHGRIYPIVCTVPV